MPAGIMAGFVVSGGIGFEGAVTFWLVLLVIVGIVVALIGVLGAENRHAKMTEEEFEEEAKRNSAIGAGVLELQKAFQPNRVTQYVEEKQRVKEESSFSGDPPHEPIVPEGSHQEDEDTSDSTEAR